MFQQVMMFACAMSLFSQTRAVSKRYAQPRILDRYIADTDINVTAVSDYPAFVMASSDQTCWLDVDDPAGRSFVFPSNTSCAYGKCVMWP
jgi:hypothetical protein